MDLSAPRRANLEFLLDHVSKIPYSKINDTSFPISRIKKILRMDRNVNLIGWEVFSKPPIKVPILLSHLTDLFIRDLSFSSWNYTRNTERRVLRKYDINIAAFANPEFDFLINVMPYGDMIQQQVRSSRLT
ncbi:hypothetical protein MXB_1785 [Myxobolus squamalis]|nr:hypothetical protein MXB_1785 [Myxobolus squamalis]